MSDARANTAAGAHSCVVDPGLKDAQAVRGLSGGRYGRMFPGLPPCEVDVEGAVALGASASRMDATLPVVDAALQNPRIPAGFSVLGQFVAHDITADRSLLAPHATLEEIRNARAPRLDLECVYGDGPVGNPFLYDKDDPDKLLIGANAAGEPADDLPRNQQGTALVGDPRNDVHLLISQLHLAFLRFHNRLVDRLRGAGVPGGEVFDEARRLVRWHYEWVVVHEFLPLTVGEELLADLEAGGRKFYEPAESPTIPVEFSDAAYRFGHSQITPTYRLNDASGGVTIFPDCLGGRPVPPGRVIDWSWFFDVPGSGHAPQPSRKLVASLTHALIELPEQIVGHTEIPAHHSLASRDLQRGAALGLPSGEAVAGAMGVEPLTPDECGLGPGWTAETPLWYYVFKEAEVRAAGERLGPVGGRIVAEVLLGLLDADPGSYRNAGPGWRPELPSPRPGHFTVADLVFFAGGAGEASR
ncbi:MAG TPA: heme peroxidase family protein [Rubrobacter sp.]|nr:heme peroxidase family protein [Rubrobacter sp.]